MRLHLRDSAPTSESTLPLDSCSRSGLGISATGSCTGTLLAVVAPFVVGTWFRDVDDTVKTSEFGGELLGERNHIHP
jgi:hypothetical protein